MGDTTEPKSWAEDLQNYVKAKRHTVPVPVDPVAPQRRYRDPRFNKQAEQREYNPVRGRWADPNKEQKVLRDEDRQKTRSVNRGRKVTLKYDTPYNIVTNAEKEGMSLNDLSREALIQQLAEKDLHSAIRPYNIISNKDFSEHHWAPEKLRPTKQHQSAAASSLASQVENRQYDIISNRYWAGNEERSRREVEEQLTQAAQKYYAKNTLDPVRGLYVDPQREEEDQLKAKQRREKLEQQRDSSLPTWHKKGQGAQYNITAPARVKNKVLLKEEEERYRRHLAGKQLKYQTEERIHEDMIKQEEKERKAAQTKVSYTRFLQSVERGYNILDNAPLQGRRALRKVYEPPMTHDSDPWSILTGQSSKHADGFFAADPAAIPLSHRLPARRESNSGTENHNTRDSERPQGRSSSAAAVRSGQSSASRQRAVWKRPASSATAAQPGSDRGGARVRGVAPRSAGQQPAYLRRVKVQQTDRIRW